jgi:lysozyme
MTHDTLCSRLLADLAQLLANRPTTARDLLIGTALCATALACGSAPSDESAEKTGWTSQPVTVCAGGSTVKGVDVSVYQGSVDWSAVKAAGYDFAFARVSDGTANPDSTFAGNWSGMKSAGVVRGVYQFFRASVDPTAQADLLVSAVGTLESGDLSPVANVEVMDGESGATLVANLATWVSVIKSKTGRTPIIYTAPGFWDALPSTGQFSGETLWVANWQVSCPDTPTPWTSWKFWQNADNGSVSGISGAVDTDEFNGTLAELQSSGGAAPYAAQFVSQSFPLASTTMKMTAGQVIPSYIELKNVGTKTWDSKTRIGTTQPRDRVSVFADKTWVADNRPAQVTGTVPPGGTYKFTFDLAAPDKDGTYDEFFGVLEEGVAWFSDPGQGGPPDNDLEVKISVTGTAPASDAGTKESDAGTHAGDGGAHASDAGTVDDDSGTIGSQPPGEDGGTGTAEPDAGDADGGGTSKAGSSGGCSLGATRGDTPTWAIGLGLMLVASVARRRRGPSLSS